VAVSLADTMEFFRQNGADHLVDACGVHVYPDGNPHKPVEARIASLGQDLSSMCTPAKPCWLTEWGIPNGSQTCPIDETSRALAIQSVRAALKQFVEQRQLTAVLYYDWLNIPGQKVESYAIFRCGALTDAGKLALSPMQ
jgi:Glycosyl hydrolase catalytic core